MNYRRRSIRLKDYDYAQGGAYYVTLCTQNRLCLFGEIDYLALKLNQVGIMIEHWWHELNKKFPTIETDEYVVMPNHFHGVVIVGADLCVCPEEGAHAGAPLQNPTLGDIVQWFKTMTTNAYIRGVKEQAWQPFQGKLWQRNYYEEIIWSEERLDTVRQYIQLNPAYWAEDEDNPLNYPKSPQM